MNANQIINVFSEPLFVTITDELKSLFLRTAVTTRDRHMPVELLTFITIRHQHDMWRSWQCGFTCSKFFAAVALPHPYSLTTCLSACCLCYFFSSNLIVPLFVFRSSTTDNQYIFRWTFFTSALPTTTDRLKENMQNFTCQSTREITATLSITIIILVVDFFLPLEFFFYSRVFLLRLLLLSLLNLHAPVSAGAVAHSSDKKRVLQIYILKYYHLVRPQPRPPLPMDGWLCF